MFIRSSRELGEAIRQARRRQGLTQAALAARAGVRQALISDLETGVTRARLDTILTVLGALQLDLTLAPRRDDDFDPAAY
ncbi:helix-turn-helix domain-containing protein [Granulosicoccaceae sp. 1_MG-2023]|nr:helix-turn-helix domain-containing protein [Granulosicoccaceae sp. 1_MG-2023]